MTSLSRASRLLSHEDLEDAFKSDDRVAFLAKQIERDFFRGKAEFSDNAGSMLAPPRSGPVADLCNSIQYDLASPADPSCECGAAKCGIGRGMAGHSSWCPWKEK